MQGWALQLQQKERKVTAEVPAWLGWCGEGIPRAAIRQSTKNVLLQSSFRTMRWNKAAALMPETSAHILSPRSQSWLEVGLSLRCIPPDQAPIPRCWPEAGIVSPSNFSLLQFRTSRNNCLIMTFLYFYYYDLSEKMLSRVKLGK